MKPSDRLELDAVRTQQRILRREIDVLDLRLDRLAENLAQPEPVVEKFTPPPPVSPPPPIAPPPLPTPRVTLPEPPVVKAFVPVPPEAVAEPAGDAVEFRVGSFWLVRLGIVILLTGLVFLGNYAYHHVIAQIGPLGKVALMYLAGGLLAGAGVWIERGAEKMRNYARVLIAGGAAAIYYTTYAAHFVTGLQVVESPLIGGGLLLALAGGIAWFADRRKSQTIALLSVLLSYYTAAINPVAGFSLFSNLLLTALAVFFLARHRWTQVSFASLVATYASFAWWRFYQTGHLVAPTQMSPAEFWPQSLFLLGYWALFTVAVFLSRAAVLSPEARTPFFTTNNAAFFGLVGSTVSLAYPGQFGTFAIGFGVVLLALALVARRFRGDDLMMDGAYLAQGLALVTIGIIAKFTGYQLALSLAVESAVLLELSRFRHGRLYQIASGFVAVGAFVFAVQMFGQQRAQVVPLGSALAAIFVFNAWRFKQSRGLLAEPRFRWRPAAFVALALVLLLAVVREGFGPVTFVPALAIVAVLCAMSLHVLRLPEVAMLGQGLLVIAHLAWLAAGHRGVPDWHAGTLLASSLALMHWWPRQRAMALAPQTINAVTLPYAGAATFALHWWLTPSFPPQSWMITSIGLALVLLAYGLATRAWWLAGLSQTFVAVGMWRFLQQIGEGPWPRSFEWTPLVALALLAIQTIVLRQLARRLPAEFGDAVRFLAKGYAMVWTVFAGMWVLAFVPTAAQFSTLVALGVACLVGAKLLRQSEAMWHALLLGGGALLLFVIRLLAGDGPWALDAVGFLLLLGMQQWARRQASLESAFPATAHLALMAAGLVGLWIHGTQLVLHGAHGHLLTIAWSMLAFAILAAGFAFRERFYRRFALALLGLSVARVFIFDVWRFETLYRILSFVVLGVVLIVISFFYNRLTPRAPKPPVLPIAQPKPTT